MHIEATELEDGTTLERDVCIVGSGPAGSIVAANLARSGREIIVIESGGRQFDLKNQHLYTGHVTGNVMPDSPYLSISRLRMVGGTSNHWSGWCRPLDAPDFEEREWLPYSGWPFTKEDLNPYYERADEFLGFRFGGSDASGRQLPSPILFPHGGQRIRTSFFDISPLTNKLHHPHGEFQTRYWKLFRKKQGVDILTHANVVRIQADSNGQRIRHVSILTLSGKKLMVRARIFVIAAGGIENARLLLASNDVMKDGLGNDRDLVGRFFMEHPHISFPSRILFVNGPRSLASFRHYRDERLKQQSLGVLAPSDDVLRNEKLLNFCVQFDLTQKLEHPKSDFGTAVSHMARRLALVTSQDNGDSAEPFGWAQKSLENHLVPLYLRMEQVPNPSNRVTLHRLERDQLGVPVPVLHWELNDLDYNGYRRALELLGREIARAGIGRLQIVHPEIKAPGIVTGGYHHMGTTRMHSDPRKGVCDSLGRVHGIQNLFVAGSSLFPTGGVSNPTFTIAALSVRLAESLQEQLRRTA